ncbi:MAG: hypothetical protein ACJA08_001833 [Cyclobacteriaceae bacterium]|jgi:hypothetical protein
MKAKVIILPDAKTDLVESIRWYEIHKPGLGKVFLKYVKSQMSTISEIPKLYQIRYRQIRNAPMRKFPYSIH